MAFLFVDVSTYKIFLYGGPDGNAGTEATVSLGIPEGWAFLKFYPQDATLPANRKVTHISGQPIYYVSYRYDQLANTIDVLRNEKPVKFFFRDDNNASYLTTGDEPVGEEEMPA